ncbi:MAG TPA: efflux RND transporter periplasmic adaptor subunit [Thermoanaerobaculia bacterium]|nr:efflux RND transporter periplasmic adaptor subunit [Thermoanaerobaculia bacterium]
MNRGKSMAVWAAALVLLALAAFAVAHRGEPEGEGGSAALAEVERRTIDVVAEAAGLVEPVRVVEVKSNASGEVLQVAVETGDRVARGTLLAEIDPRDVQSAVDQAAADLESARVALATAEAERGRSRRLRDAGLVPAQDDERTVEVTAASRAALVRARTTLRLAQEKRQDVTIRAPIAGTVIERTVEPGQIIASATSNVSGGTTLFRMADLAAMQVRANVDEVDIGRIRSGQPAEVTVEAYPGRVFRGTVAKIEPQAVVEQNVTMFPVLVRLPNPEGLLRPGMNAEVSVEIARREDVVAVPNAAVVSPREARAAAEVLGVDEDAFGALRSGRDAAGAAGGGPGGRRGRAASGETAAGDTRPAVVFVQAAGGPQPRRVVLGLSDWEHTEVVRGVEPGERVVLVSVAQLQQRQAERSERLRERMSGPLGGGGARGGGGSRRPGGR